MTRQLSSIEAEVYKGAFIYHVKDPSSEPSVDELAGIAELFGHLVQMQRAADARQEVLEPFVVPLLEETARRLRLSKEESEASDIEGEREVAEQHGKELVACEALIERAKAYKPVACFWCGEPATLRDITAPEESPAEKDAWCGKCARFEFAKRTGEMSALSEVVSAFVTGLEGIGICGDGIREAIDSSLRGEDVLIGAERAQEDWIMAHRDRHHADSYLSQFEPPKTVEAVTA